MESNIESDIFSKAGKKAIWKKQFGTHFTGYDSFGRFVSQCCSDTKCCSSVSLVLPKTYGGKEIFENAMILHPKSLEEKSDKLHGIINKKYFRIINNQDGTGRLIVNNK
ncbi:MAG: hypothetical protein HPPSJP_4930 [Candidatus Hepatoplasma scabrum]|nr:MAG: hypothetical protein HPPSJP_4930 [Candidatus Hepatoplasma sp.]